MFGVSFFVVKGGGMSNDVWDRESSGVFGGYICLDFNIEKG